MLTLEPKTVWAPGTGKGYLIPPAPGSTKAEASDQERELKKKEEALAADCALSTIRLQQDADHQKHLAKEAVERQKLKTKQDKQKAKLLEQLVILEKQQKEAEAAPFVCEEDEDDILGALLLEE